MEIYYGVWKILGGAFLLFLAYSFFVVRAQKNEELHDK